MLRREFDYQEPNPKQIEKILSNHGGIHLQVKNSPENQYWVPKVLNSDSILQSEYKDSWKHYITKKNERDSTQSRGNREIRFMFYGVKIIECIFIICNLLKQPPEVKYLAVEILDRFLIIHFFQTLDQAERTGRNKFEWEEILNTILSQAFLRIMSAIQLAAKYCCNSKDVSVTSLQKLMNSIGRDRYSKKVILQSEARVYQTLNFNIPVVSPLTFIEMFFEDFSNLKREINFSISLHKFFEVSIDVLDVAVAYHKDIYEKIWFQVKNGEDQTLEDKLEFLSIEGDYTYLASGVIWTAASIIDPKSAFVDRILDFLCYLTSTKYHKLKIEMLGNLILEKILS